MQLQVALQIDPLEKLNPSSDTSLLLAWAAQQRGHKIFCYQAESLHWQAGQVWADLSLLELFDLSDASKIPDNFFLQHPAKRVNLAQMDVILMRQDPPFDMDYLTACWLLEQLPSKTLVLNNPASVRSLPEKIFPLELAEFMPPTLISSNISAIKNFLEEQKDIVIKPLYGFGGHGVFHLKEQDDNVDSLLELYATRIKEPLVAQKFLPNVKTDEKRIVLIDGEVVGAIGRIPQKDQIRSNMRVGGVATATDLTKRQQYICNHLKPLAKERGLILIGLDVVGDWLIEINITSPTGLRALKKLYNSTPEEIFWDAVESKL